MSRTKRVELVKELVRTGSISEAQGRALLDDGDSFDASKYLYGTDGKVKANPTPPDVITGVVSERQKAMAEKLNVWKEEPDLYQYTFGDWAKANNDNYDPFATSSTEGKPGECNHTWKLYQGLNHDDFYCTKCKQTRPANPAR